MCWPAGNLFLLCGGIGHHRGLLTSPELTFVDGGLQERPVSGAGAQGGPSAGGAAVCLQLGSVPGARLQLPADADQSNCVYPQPAWVLASSS